MSELAPPSESGNAVGDRQETLTPAVIEAVLADFRAWLEQAAQAGLPEHDPAALDMGESLDLHTLLAQFTALRHEVNLQTKASRVQQELNVETLRTLEKTLEALEEVQAQPASEEEIRPLLKSLIELHDNLSLARREVQRTQEALRPLLDQLAARGPALEAPASAALRVFWWKRWLGGDQAKELVALRARVRELEVWREHLQEASRRVPAFVSALITGYTMSLQRVERVLLQQDLEAIPALGLPFDPETMEAVEVVHEAGRTSSEVIEEVRRGYLWAGRLFRSAQVRVARGPAT
jgi:molecular chaperone GrpE